ncbi:MAG: hypothetical protein C5B50_08600 [Verrucomicrobia bacterium]|nr:MAG: hypothetical protein C5B50_08600 [Verrucomicrobiota bacterium]
MKQADGLQQIKTGQLNPGHRSLWYETRLWRQHRTRLASKRRASAVEERRVRLQKSAAWANTVQFTSAAKELFSAVSY